MKKLPSALVRSLVLAAATVAGITSAQADVSVKDVWVRATVPQQKATSAFMQLSAPVDSRLVSVATPLTPVAEVHEMRMEDGVMRMRRTTALELPAGKTVELTPGGYHVMLMDLKQQVKAGESVPVTLVFEDKDGKRSSQQVDAPARALGAAVAPAAAAHPHKH
ncbi:MAG: copper chaperone PCu(A)C [Variovorax sp.]|nr:MAG: copper chaperone PCu(A)C [Variovorax sp.]